MPFPLLGVGLGSLAGAVGGFVMKIIDSKLFQAVAIRAMITGILMTVVPKLISYIFSSYGKNLMQYLLDKVAPHFTSFFQNPHIVSVSGLGAWFAQELYLDRCVLIMISAAVSYGTIRLSLMIGKIFTMSVSSLGVPSS